MEFSRQEYWNGLPFPFPRYIPNSGIKPMSPALQTDSLPFEPSGKPKIAQETLNQEIQGVVEAGKTGMDGFSSKDCRRNSVLIKL